MDTLHYVLELARLSTYGSGLVTVEAGSLIYASAERAHREGLLRAFCRGGLIVIEGLSNTGFMRLTELGMGDAGDAEGGGADAPGPPAAAVPARGNRDDPRPPRVDGPAVAAVGRAV